MISNQDRLNLIRSFCEDDFENEVENVLKDIFEKGSYELKSLIKLFNLMDNSMLRFIRRKIRSSFKNYYLSTFLDYRMKKTTYSDLNKNYRIGPIYILWIID